MPPADPGPAAGRQRLNAADRVLLLVDRALRGLGGPGFETQTFVRLAGRLDRARLNSALVEISRRWPVLTARLVEAGDRGGPCWVFRPGAILPLHETVLPGTSASALEYAGGLFADECDPTNVDPVRFHLLHGMDGQDLLLLRYNHALLDHAGAVLLLRQLDGGASAPPPEGPWRDPIWAYLRRWTRQRRREAARAAEQWRKAMRGGAIHLGRPVAAGSSPIRLRVTSRRIDGAAALQARAARVSGVPSLSMTVLASAFRAIARLAGDSPRGRYFNTGIGVDLGLGRVRSEAWQNLASLVPILAHPDEMGSREELVQRLVRQFRGRLASGMDLGVLALSAAFGRMPRPGQWAIELMLRYCVSLWYGCFGALDAVGPSLCGAEVEDVFGAGPSWPPVGLTLLVNVYRDRLYLQATHAPDCVPDDLAEAFLDLVTADIRDGAVGPAVCF